MNKRMGTFLVGMLLIIAAVKADYCTIVTSDNNAVYNVTDFNLAAYLPLGAGDVVGVDISGNDLPAMPIYFQNLGTTENLGVACRNACSNTDTCAYYAYDICANSGAGACWLKTAMSNPTEQGCRAYGSMSKSVPIDVGGGNYTMNLCHTTSCGSYVDCQLCQNIGSPASQYCTGNDDGAMYTALASPYSSYVGYDMAFYGDSIYCPGNNRRFSIVHVLCNQPDNKLIFLDEYVTCSYEYEVYLTGNCSFVPPTPTLTFSSQSSTSIKITINPDSHLYNLDYPLDIKYVVYLGSNAIYTGATTTFIYDTLPADPYYYFTVEGIYNGRHSPISQTYQIQANNNQMPGEQVIEEMISVLGDQVAQSGQTFQSQLKSVSSRLDVDVVQTLRHADDDTTQIKGQLVMINNHTLQNISRQQAAVQDAVNNVQSTVNNLDQRLNSKTVGDMTTKLFNIDDQTYDLRAQFTKLNAQIVNQTAVVQQLIGQQGSGGSSGGGMVALGIVIGIVIGVIGTVVAKRILQQRSPSI